jgi:hypothetical protein
MRTINLVVLAFISFNTIAQNLNSGLVVCLPMNGNATDFSGYNNNGAINNASLTSDRFGNPNSAYLFNGTNSYISIPFSTSIDSIEIKDELTITAWCNVFNWYQNWNVFPIVNKHNATTDYGWDYNIQAPVGCSEQLFVANISQQSNLCAYTAPGTTTFNSWNHYAITYSKSSGIFRAYKNGALTTTLVINNLQLENTGTGSVYIGYSPAGPDEYADGKIDDLKMYCRALSPTEILAVYNGSAACCVSAPITPLSINGTTTVCSGAASVYSVVPVSGASSYSWAMPNGWLGSSTTNSILAMPVATGVLSVTAINSCGTGSAQTLTITVIPAPTVTVAGVTSICAGAGLTLVASGANSYSWSNGSQNSTLQVSPLVNTTYTVTGTSAGCSHSIVKTITVNPLPVLSIAGNNSICRGKSSTLIASGATSYSWNNGANTTSLQVSPLATTIYTLNGTNSSGCSASMLYTVTVNNLPTITANTSSQLICMGQTATLSANGANTYSWSNGMSGNPISVNPTLTTIYTVTGQDANNCKNETTLYLVVEPCTSLYSNDTELVSYFKIFPNPVTTEFVHITLNDATEDDGLVVAIYSYEGKLITYKTLTPQFNQVYLLDVSELCKGYYTLVASSQKHEKAFKLIRN